VNNCGVRLDSGPTKPIRSNSNLLFKIYIRSFYKFKLIRIGQMRTDDGLTKEKVNNVTNIVEDDFRLWFLQLHHRHVFSPSLRHRTDATATPPQRHLQHKSKQNRAEPRRLEQNETNMRPPRHVGLLLYV